MADVLADVFVGLLRSVPDGDGDGPSMFEAAAKGDLERVKAIVKGHPEKVNTTLIM